MAATSLVLFALGLWNKSEYRFNENRGRFYLPRGSKKHIGSSFAFESS